MRVKRTPGAWLSRQLLPRLTLLLGLFAAYSQVSSTLHWVVVQHVRCADHGEWVHVGEGHHAHEAEHATQASPSVAAADGESHGHDHCHFLVDPRTFAAVPSPKVVLSHAGEWSRPGLTRPSDAGRQILLYELAPKTSPPAARS
jgi:hypothetical protein